MDWVIEELATLSFGDKRLKKRGEKVLTQLSRNATDSIPTACGGAGETKAAYRFLLMSELRQKKYTAHIKKQPWCECQSTL